MSDPQKYSIGRTAGLSAVIVTGIGAIVGSGGGGGGGGSTPTPVEYLEITSANADDVAGAVIQTVGSSFELADAGGGEITADAAAAPGAGSSRLYAARYRTVLPRLRSQALRVGPLASVGPVTDPCLADGSITLSGDVADPDALSIGDRITAVFNDCDDGDGDVIDGRLELVIRAIQGDPLGDVFLLRTDAEVTAFSITADGETTSADGGFELTLDSLAFPLVRTRLAGDSLEVTAGGDTVTLTNFDESIESNASVLPYTELANAVGTLASRVLDGKVDYETTEPIEGPAGDAKETGEVLIAGANGATIRVVLQSQSSVDLEIDLDGDGAADEVQSTTWAELGGAVAPGVTAGNAAAVAREALAATEQFEFVVRDAGNQFDDGAFRFAADNVSVPGPFGPVSSLCQLANGSASVSGQLAVPGTFTIGDHFDGTFVNCSQETAIGQFPFTTLLNGLLATVVTDSLPSAFVVVSFDGEAMDFKGANGQFAATYNGDPITSSWRGTSPAMQLAGTFSSPRALVDASVDTINDTFFSPARITRTVVGVVYTSVIPGRYVLETLTPLVSNGDFDMATGPVSGEIKVTADNGTSVRVVAVTDLTARLDMDLDGNGSIDQSTTVPWQELR